MRDLLSSDVLEALGSSKLTAPEVAEALQRELQPVAKCLSNLVARGRVRRAGRRDQRTLYEAVPLDGSPVRHDPPDGAPTPTVYGLLTDGRLFSLQGEEATVFTLDESAQIRSLFRGERTA